MNKVSRFKHIPNESIILLGFDRFDYFDAYSIEFNSNDTVDELTNQLFQVPKWVDFLMRLRHQIVKIFGLKTEYKNQLNITNYYPIGSKAVAFTVLNRNENEIVMCETDKHLDFRTSVLIIDQENRKLVALITLVRYNNLLGRVYFIFVKPFHRIIVKSLLKQLK